MRFRRATVERRRGHLLTSKQFRWFGSSSSSSRYRRCGDRPTVETRRRSRRGEVGCWLLTDWRRRWVEITGWFACSRFDGCVWRFVHWARMAGEWVPRVLFYWLILAA